MAPATCNDLRAGDQSATIIYNGVTTTVTPLNRAGEDLWTTTADLTKAAKLELKAQGVCSEKSCVPLPDSRKGEFISEQSGTTYLNLSEFARLLKQPVAHDAKNKVWFFGPRPQEQNSHLASLKAPDFTLPDLNGKQHSLSDFRGKKVLLITWASW
jgi:hypothetical protein